MITTGRTRTIKTKDDQVADLMRKTVENGATPAEEASAIQLAHMTVRQNGLDLDAFKAALATIGDPPRYAITADGFLVPADALRTFEVPAPDRATGRMEEMPEEAPAHGNATADGQCNESPTGRHRMEQYMQGTVATGALYCIHCGVRTQPPTRAGQRNSAS